MRGAWSARVAFWQHGALYKLETRKGWKNTARLKDIVTLNPPVDKLTDGTYRLRVGTAIEALMTSHDLARSRTTHDLA